MVDKVDGGVRGHVCADEGGVSWWAKLFGSGGGSVGARDGVGRLGVLVC